jgi:hypothetical protein
MNSPQVERSVLATAAPESAQSAVSWAAIFAGATVAASASLVLVAVGSGLDLLSVSPWPGRGVGAAAFTTMTAIWLIVIQWIASGTGGYLTGRLRTKWVATHTHEVFFRDTAHGFVTWSLATLLTAALFASVAGSLLSGGAHAAMEAAPGFARGGASGPGAGGYDLDVLFRNTGSSGARPASATDPRPEAARILANGLASGQVSAADRTYLASLVASNTGVAEPEASARVDTFITNSKAAADKAREASAAFAIFSAISMLIGAFIACVAAALGGQRRDAVMVVDTPRWTS